MSNLTAQLFRRWWEQTYEDDLMSGDARQKVDSSENWERCRPWLLDSVPESRGSTEGPIRKLSRGFGCRANVPSPPRSPATLGNPPDKEVSIYMSGYITAY